MPAKIFWFLPTDGESRSIVGASHASAQHTIPEGYRARNRRYLAEIGRAADRLGYEGVLTPTGTWREDAWLTASALLAETERLKFLVAFRPGLVPPTLAAQQAAAFQRFSDGRLLLNLSVAVTTPNNWENESLDFIGEVYTIKDGRMSEPPNPFVGCRQSGPRWCGYHARRKSRRGRQADLGVPLVIVGAEESLIEKRPGRRMPSASGLRRPRPGRARTAATAKRG